MTDIVNYHDRFFKEVFSRPETAEGFVMNFVPADVSGALKPNTFRLQKDSFVDAQLAEHFSDLLYEAEFKDGEGALVYLLFEHKSRPDPEVAYQLWRYITRVWDYSARHGVRPFRPVIPIVLYHGTAKWNVPRNFAALYKAPAAVRRGLLDFTYYLCDLSEYSDEAIKTLTMAVPVLGVALLVMRNFRNPDLSKMLRNHLELIRVMSRQSALECLETLLRYLAYAKQPVKQEDLTVALEGALGEQGEIFMESLLDKWMNEGFEKGIQQGILRGREQGREEGRQAGTASLTIRLLTHRLGRLDDADLERVRKLAVEDLERLGEDLLDFPDRSALTEWLDRSGACH